MEYIALNENSDVSKSNKLLMFDKIERGDNDLYYSRKEEVNLEINLNVRQSYICKAYFILFIQVDVIFVFTLFFKESETLQNFMRTNICIIIFIFLMSVSSIIIIHFSQIMKKSAPKYIVLLSFTIAESYCTGFIYVNLSLKIFFWSVFISLGIMILLTLCSKNSDFDINYQGNNFKIAFILLFLVFIFYIFTSNNFRNLIISLLIVFFYFFYIINDIQTISEEKLFKILVDYFMLFINIFNLLKYFSG